MSLQPFPVPIDRRAWMVQAATATVAWGVLSPGRAWGQPATRQKRLIARQDQPFNGEPPLDQLANSWLTPWELFFVRSHGAVPHIDPATYRLQIEGLVEHPLSLSLGELQTRFEFTTVSATLTCAGNRRDEFIAEKPIAGVPWNAGAIGHAKWGGYPLAEVLQAAGLKAEAKHVWFEGADEVDDPVLGIKAPFGGSIPLERVLANAQHIPGVLLTTHMQEQPLTAEHGAPLRLIVPGYIGARSVKWLRKLVVSDQPSPNRFLARDYKLLYQAPAQDIQTIEPILEYVLNSAIVDPSPGSRHRAERILVRGYALAEGKPGRQIVRVEVSSDQGRTWQEAQITSPRRDYCWVTWSVSVPLQVGPNTLLVRATDSSGQTQPEKARWNLKGYQNNGWHRVAVVREA